jgi:hypothetical protein
MVVNRVLLFILNLTNLNFAFDLFDIEKLTKNVCFAFDIKNTITYRKLK